MYVCTYVGVRSELLVIVDLEEFGLVLNSYAPCH